MLINPYAPPAEPTDKLVTIKTRSGEKVGMEVTLADDKGRQSAAEYLLHLFGTIKKKMGEPEIFVGEVKADPANQEEIKRQILYVAGFHDSMFGTFNRKSQLPDEERNEFVEIFLLACATLLDGKNILIDLEKGRISNESRLN